MSRTHTSGVHTDGSPAGPGKPGRGPAGRGRTGRRAGRVTRAGAAFTVLALVLGLLGGLPASASAQSGEAAADSRRVPLLAYYYQWFQPSSWQRAKIDYPLLGRYSSEDPKIIRTHIAWAKWAGIDGFIVSWKSTPVDNRRLRLLMSAAAAANFKVTVIYQGLDFHRHPLPESKVAADFAYFARSFADSPVLFRMGGKPLTVFSGTWAYSHDQVARITGPVRDRMLVLNTEKSTQGYERLADVTDGDAYYWSSVNPDTNPNHAGKLREMSQAVHAHHGYWVAPFAPGFDARMVGGSKQVPRKNGATLRAEYAAAVGSQPDALGLISWNEFSENSYVEPSAAYGRRYLDVLRQLRGGPARGSDTGPDATAAPRQHAAAPSYWPNVLRLIGFAAVLMAGVTLIGRYRRPRTPADDGLASHTAADRAPWGTESRAESRDGDGVESRVR